MKLRNKKTGKIYTLSDDFLDKLYYEWEDYKPTEPLIKDPKIRKAVRAWAEANDIERVQYLYDGNILWFDDNEIDFKHLEPLALELNVYYTIEELCGEEEE